MARNLSAIAHAVLRSWTWPKNVGDDIFSVVQQGPRSAVLYEFALPDSLRVATGRSMSLFCTPFHQEDAVFVLSQRVPGTWAHWCLSLLHQHAVGSPGYHGVGVVVLLL